MKKKVADPIKQVPTSHSILNSLVWIVSILNPISQIPQVYRVYKNQSAGDLALTTWVMLLITSIVWFWYGLIHKSKPIAFTNFCFIIINIFIIIAIIMWGSIDLI